jgi:hypothetical protein
MRNFHFFTTVMCCCCFAVFVTAQNPNANSTEMASIQGSNTTASGGNNDIRRISNETPEQARLQIINALSAFRSTSTAVDTLLLVKDDAKTIEAAKNTQVNFAEYVEKMEKNLQKRLKDLETDPIKDYLQMPERSALLRGLNILKSAKCLTDRKDGLFAKTKDLDGFDIIAYPVDTLRSNARYGFIETYREGFARIKKDQVFGYLNLCGDEVIPCQFQQAEPFNDGRALVKKVDWYFIDANGEEGNTLENITEARAIQHGISLIRFSNGKYAFINNRYDESKVLLSAQYDAIEPFYKKNIFIVRVGKKYGLITLNGNVKLDPTYDFIEPTEIPTIYKISTNGKVGIMDTTWTVRFQPEFEEIGAVNQYGLAVAKTGTHQRLLSIKTFKASKLYDGIGDFSDIGLANIRIEKSYGLIDQNMKVVLEPTYASIGAFNKFGLAQVSKAEKQLGFIRTDGREVINSIYEQVSEFNQYGLVAVKEVLKDCDESKVCKYVFSVFNKTGQLILRKPQEDSLSRIRFEVTDIIHSEKYNAIVAFNETSSEPSGYHLIELGTYRVVNRLPYEIIGNLDMNGFFAVRREKVWGLMDTLGKIVVKPTFLEINRPSEGYYPVKHSNGKFGFVDKKGKTQIPFEYDQVQRFKNGICVISKGKDKFGLINRFNAKIGPCTFRSITELENGTYELLDDDGNKYIINAKGDCEKNCTKFEELRKKANQ